MNVLEFSLLSDTKVVDLLDRSEFLISVHEFEYIGYRVIVDEPIQPKVLLGGLFVTAR